jgi:hypothetical protein
VLIIYSEVIDDYVFLLSVATLVVLGIFYVSNRCYSLRSIISIIDLVKKLYEISDTYYGSKVLVGFCTVLLLFQSDRKSVKLVSYSPTSIVFLLGRNTPW